MQFLKAIGSTITTTCDALNVSIVTTGRVVNKSLITIEKVVDGADAYAESFKQDALQEAEEAAHKREARRIELAKEIEALMIEA